MFKIFLIVFEQSMIYLPLVLAGYISFSLLKIPDLSLETAYLIGAFFGGLTLQAMQGYSLPVALIGVLCASLVGGMFVGTISSCMTRFGNIPHLLSTIITFGLFQGLFLMVSNPYVSLAKYDNVLMIAPCFLKHPELLTLMMINIIICCLCMYLFRTQLGYSFAIFGQNPEFFKHFKISTNYVFIMGVVIANGLAGLAGFFFAQTNSLIEMNMGVGKALFCITALILGKAVVCHMNKSVLVPITGVGLYFGLQQLLLKVGFDLKYFTMVQSLLVLVILLKTYKKNRAQHDQLGV
jgi:putative ABC transport system permease protein